MEQLNTANDSGGQTFVIDKGVLTKYNGSDEEVAIPYGVETVGARAFLNCRELRWVSIPETVTAIGACAFKGCTGLKRVRIPDSVWVIGSSAFEGCASLKAIAVPDSVTTLFDGTFRGCAALEEVSLTTALYAVAHDAFAGCGSIKRVHIRNTVFTPEWGGALPESDEPPVWDYDGNPFADLQNDPRGGYATFSYSKWFGSALNTNDWGKVEIGADVGIRLGQYKGGDADIVVPQLVDGRAVTAISPHTFSRCSGIKSVTLPETIGSIGHYAFRDCTELTSVNLPHRVASIGKNAFGGCSELKELHLPERVHSIDSLAFFNCSGLKSLTLPKRLKSLAFNAFYGCTGLEEIRVARGSRYFASVDGVLLSADGRELFRYPSQKMSEEYAVPDGVKLVFDAFQGCPYLKRLILPASVEIVTFTNLAGCDALKEIIIHGEPRIEITSAALRRRAIYTDRAAGEWHEREMRIAVAAGYVKGRNGGFAYSESTAKANKEYIEKYRSEFLPLFAAYDGLLQYMAGEGLILPQDFDMLLSLYSGRTDIIAALLEVRGGLPEEDIDYSLD